MSPYILCKKCWVFKNSSCKIYITYKVQISTESLFDHVLPKKFTVSLARFRYLDFVQLCGKALISQYSLWKIDLSKIHHVKSILRRKCRFSQTMYLIVFCQYSLIFLCFWQFWRNLYANGAKCKQWHQQRSAYRKQRYKHNLPPILHNIRFTDLVCACQFELLY